MKFSLTAWPPKNAKCVLGPRKEAVTGELDKRLTILLPDQDDDFDKAEPEKQKAAQGADFVEHAGKLAIGMCVGAQGPIGE